MKPSMVIGIGLVIVTIFGFGLMIVTSLPSEEEAKRAAEPIPNLAQDFTAVNNELNLQISELRTPANVPVRVNPNDLGRRSIFDGF